MCHEYPGQILPVDHSWQVSPGPPTGTSRHHKRPQIQKSCNDCARKIHHVSECLLSCSNYSTWRHFTLLHLQLHLLKGFLGDMCTEARAHTHITLNSLQSLKVFTKPYEIRCNSLAVSLKSNGLNMNDISWGQCAVDTMGKREESPHPAEDMVWIHLDAPGTFWLPAWHSRPVI